MRVEALTFLRFIAAFVVVTGHYGSKTSFAELVGPFAVAGPPMVTFFFVLSGFVLMMSQWAKPGASAKSFYLARFARIAPIYWVALLATCWFGSVRGPYPTTGIVLNAAFLQAWFPPWPLSVNGPAWSVSVEAFFYLLFPFIVSASRRAVWTPRRLIVAALAFWAGTQVVLTTWLNSGSYGFPSAVHDAIFYMPTSHLCSFVLGVAGGHWVLERVGERRDAGRAGLALVVALFIVVFVVVQHRAGFGHWAGVRLPVGSSLLAPLFLALILGVARADNWVTRLLSTKPLRTLGDISYAVYILQRPIGKLYEAQLLDGHRVTTDGEFWGFVALLVAVAYLSGRLIENPARRLILGTRSKPPG